MLPTRALARLPSQALLSLPRASFTTAAKATPKSPSLKPLPTTPKPLPPTSKVAPPSKQPKKDVDLSDFSDDFVVDASPIASISTPVQPFAKPIQPFAKKPAAPAAKAAPIPRPPTSTPPTTTLSFNSNAAPIPLTPTPTTPTPTFTAPIPEPVIITPNTNAFIPNTTTAPPPPPPPAPNAATAKPKPHHPKKPAAKQPAGINPIGVPHQAAQKAALTKDLAGRTPAQLLTQIAQLQQHNSTLQGQLVYHSAVDAIYGETGFNQLRNLLSEFSEEESMAIKTSGFDGETVVHQLETRQRELALQFTQAMGSELNKHITSTVKKLKDQHRQSASAATATQQTLRNAGVPEAVISGTITSLQPHLDELQIKIVRWEKLKADIDLLLATYSSNH